MFNLELLKDSKPPTLLSSIYTCYAYTPTTIHPNTTSLVNIGFKLQVPPSHFVHVFSTKYKALGGVGDSDYRGVYNVIVFNDTEDCIYIEKGDEVGCICFIEIGSVGEVVLI